MLVNSYASRTFNDINQYFIFPWVLNDFTSNELRLNDDKYYRNLEKPIGALNQERLELAKIRHQSRQKDDPDLDMLFGSHYSHSTIVINYLVRLEPFAYLHYNLQNSKNWNINCLIYFQISLICLIDYFIQFQHNGQVVWNKM